MAERFFVSVGVLIFFPVINGIYYVLFDEFPYLLAVLFSMVVTYSLMFWFLIAYLVTKRPMIATLISCAIYIPINYFLGLERSRNVNLSSRHDGIDYYIKGEITTAGIISKIEVYCFEFVVLLFVSVLVSKFVKRFTDAHQRQ